MKNTTISVFVVGILTLLNACTKSDFLNKKPATNILTPTTLTDYQNLLDNAQVINATGGLCLLSGDEYVVSYANWQTGSATERNAYIWAKDIYNSDVGIGDWNQLYQEVFYANSVLDGLSKTDSTTSTQAQYLKGWALFVRAFAFYDLTRTFCKAYNSNTASTDLGIPLRLSSSIDYSKQRATLQQTFDQIFADLNQAAGLLPVTRPSANLNRPSKIAVYALMARIYLDMRDYVNADNYANQCLNIYNSLIDYNTVSITASTPFSATNDELIYNTSQVPDYGIYTPTSKISAGNIPLSIINLYSPNDLRVNIYFGQLNGNYYRKRGYYGSQSIYSFTGLATDEVYLIHAECLARNGQGDAAMNTLNQLIIKRYKTNTFVPLTAGSAAGALDLVLQERRKELIWRGLRWFDLKRFNAQGDNITLTRDLNGVTYTLPPNDNRWVMPIPNDEIALSGIQQNPR